MKRIGLVLVVTGWVAVSGAFAAPVGSGGRLYYTVTDYRDVADNVTRLFRVDVDSNWDNLTAGTQIATVANEYGLLGGTSTTYDRKHRSCTSPEILHPRKYGGDGKIRVNDDGITAALPDGDVLIVYYAGPETDMTAIEWARVRP